MAEFRIRSPEGVDYDVGGPTDLSRDEIIDLVQHWMGSPAGKVDQSFRDLKNNRDPMQGASKLARTLSSGDNPFANLDRDQMTAMMAGNAGGMVAGLSPVWAPAVPPIAGAAARYGAGAAALGAAEHFAPDSIKDYVRDFILLKMLGHR